MTCAALIVAADTICVSDLRAADLRPWGMGKYTGRQTLCTHKEIAQLAYCLYESRDRQDGQRH